MMNKHSKRWRSAALLLALAVGGCGGGSDGGAANKAEWQAEHGAVISVVSDDIDRSNQALSSGERALLLSTCTQLLEEVGDAREALPVPDPTVDAALRSALDATETAATSCVEGARVASEAHRVEVAQEEMKTARERFDEAQGAIEAWS